MHGFDEVRALESDALHRGARDMRARRAAREADQQAARIGVPLRGAESGERGHEVDVAGVGHAGRERLDFVRALNDSQAIAQPLHGGAAHEHAAFKCELAGARAPRGHRGKQAVPREPRLRPREREREAPGAISVLRQARQAAALAEQCRLLIAGDAGHR